MHIPLSFSLLAPSLLLLLTALSTSTQAANPNCGVNEFYSTLNANSSTWTRQELQGLLKSTHKQVQYTNAASAGTNDVWAALKELDPGLDFSVVKKVHTLYSNDDVDADPFGGNSWKKSHIWDTRRGIGSAGPDFSDVHNIRPELPAGHDGRASTVGFFGECRVLEEAGDCTEPAPGGATGTCQCKRVYEPSDSEKGEIARAVLYMDLRYDGSEADTADLRLTDCPIDLTREMGFLSQMLQWHNANDPTDREKTRNDLACTNWQGNRNPFVDFPDIVQQLYPDPEPLPTGDQANYEACKDIATPPPTGAPNACDDIQPGDLYVYLLNSEDPDEIGLFNFIDLPEGLTLYMTDNAWDGLKYKTNEGIVKLTIPSGGIPIGTIFGYGPAFENFPGGGKWEQEEGAFSLSEEGDQLFVYCFSGGNEVATKAGFSYSGPFQNSGLPNYGLNESALPPELSDVGAVAVPHFNNYLYVGPSASNQANCDDDCVKKGLENPDNYSGKDGVRFSPPNNGSGAFGNIRHGNWNSVAMSSSVTVMLILATAIL